MTHSEREALHSGTAEVRLGMEGDHSGIEEGVRFGTGAESRGRFAGGIVEVAQTLDFESDHILAVAGGRETGIAEKVVAAECRAEERQNKMNFEALLQMAFAVAAVVEGSLASQPCRNF